MLLKKNQHWAEIRYIVWKVLICTAWKVPVLGVFLVRVQSECGKIRTRKTPNMDTFHAVFTYTFRFDFFHGVFNLFVVRDINCINMRFTNKFFSVRVLWCELAISGFLFKKCFIISAWSSKGVSIVVKVMT